MPGLILRTSAELAAFGVSAVIYANQLVRASVRAMQDVLSSLRAIGATTQVEGSIASLGELFDLVDMEKPEDALAP